MQEDRSGEEKSDDVAVSSYYTLVSAAFGGLADGRP